MNASIDVTGTVGGDAEPGDTVTITVNGNDFQGTVASDLTYIVEVNAADLVNENIPEGESRSLSATVAAVDAAGNPATDGLEALTALVRPAFEVRFADGLVDGVSFTTTTDLEGDTGLEQLMGSDAPGAFVYRPGDTITMKIGNVTLAEFDADSIKGDVLFLQDIAGVGLSDVNDNYVENMAIFLQLLDEDGDPTNGIQISDATHEALADYVDPTTGEPLNMATADKQMLSDVLGHLGISFTAQSETDPDPSDGSQNVFETQAMAHVADTITEQGGERAPSTFDNRLEDSIVVPGGVIDFNYNSDVGDNGTITFTRDDLLKGAVPQQVSYDNLIVSDVAISDGFEAIGTLSYNSDTQTYTIELAEGVTREQIAGLTVDYKVQDWTVITEAVATTLDESQLTGADDAESGIEDTTINGSVANDVTTSGGV
ncbi:MAG: hypothetical protein VW961_06365, partial [Flavobacteriaceae bacterium]